MNLRRELEWEGETRERNKEARLIEWYRRGKSLNRMVGE